MANAPDAVLLIVAGSGETSPKEIEDLLNDVYGEVPELGITVPVDKDLYTSSVDNVVHWFNDDEAVFSIRTKGAPMSRKSSRLPKADEVENFAEVFSDEFSDWDAVEFLVALPDSESDDFDLYVSLVESAIEAGIPVKDLTAGLDDVRIEDDEPEPEPEPEPARKSRAKKADPEPDPVVQEEMDKIEEEPEEVKPARRSRAKKAEPEEEKSVKAVKSDSFVDTVNESLVNLSVVVQFLEKNDEMFALRNMADSVLYAPITKAAAAAYHTLAEAVRAEKGVGEATSAPEEDAEAPKRGRGRPRTSEPQEKQIWDEDDEKWIKRPRGRVAKGTKTRTINPETDEVLEEGEA